MQVSFQSLAASKPRRWSPSTGPFLPGSRPCVGNTASKRHRCHAASNDFNKSTEEFQRAASQKADELKSSAQKLFRSASQKVSGFADEQQLGEKARKVKKEATNKLQDAYGELQVRLQPRLLLSMIHRNGEKGCLYKFVSTLFALRLPWGATQVFPSLCE
jgi:hypothetical protein